MIRHDDWHSVDSEGFPKMPSKWRWLPERCEWFLMVCRRSRSRPELKLRPPNFKAYNLDAEVCLIPIWPEVPRRFPEVLRNDMEAFQNIAKTRRAIPIVRIPLSGILRGPSGRL